MPKNHKAPKLIYDSPFSPDLTNPKYFVGRKKEIERILLQIRSVLKGRQSHSFLTGERAIGKSSLAFYVQKQCSRIYPDLLSISLNLGKINDPDQLIPSIFEEILKVLGREKPKWLESIQDFFGKNLQFKANFFGLFEISYNPSQDEVESLIRNFPQVLYNLIEKIPTKENQKKGLFIILDDINGLAKNPDFPTWYKSFVEYSSTHFETFPIFFILIGIPKRFDQCNDSNPSFGRIFDFMELEPLPKNDVKEFFKQSFDQVDIQIDPILLNRMVVYSGGIPYIMQEIGKEIFQLASGSKLTREEVLTGIVSAEENLGKKHIDRQFYGVKSSEKYQKILHKIFTQYPINSVFKKQEIHKFLTQEEQKSLDNFLQRLKRLDIIQTVRPGEYQFSNVLYYQYFYMREIRSMFKKTP